MSWHIGMVYAVSILVSRTKGIKTVEFLDWPPGWSVTLGDCPLSSLQCPGGEVKDSEDMLWSTGQTVSHTWGLTTGQTGQNVSHTGGLTTGQTGQTGQTVSHTWGLTSPQSPLLSSASRQHVFCRRILPCSRKSSIWAPSEVTLDWWNPLFVIVAVNISCVIKGSWANASQLARLIFKHMHFLKLVLLCDLLSHANEGEQSPKQQKYERLYSCF